MHKPQIFCFNLLLLSSFLFYGCSPSSSSHTPKSQPKSKSKSSVLPVVNDHVHYAGALRNIMHKGDLSAHIDLKHLKEKKHLFALGALENLQGEIQILNGSPFSTYVNQSGQLEFDHSWNQKATLLVYAEVEKWSEVQIPKTVKTRQQFEKYLEREAQNQGLNLQHAFPFLIEGKIKVNQWHVIKWDLNDPIHTHKKHIESGIHQTAHNTDLTLLGFYSQNHTGIYTHHTTQMHIHFVDQARKSAGHSDDFQLGENMILKLPSDSIYHANSQ